MEKVESPAKVHVFYIDYGNVSTIPKPECGFLVGPLLMFHQSVPVLGLPVI